MIYEKSTIEPRLFDLEKCSSSRFWASLPDPSEIRRQLAEEQLRAHRAVARLLALSPEERSGWMADRPEEASFSFCDLCLQQVRRFSFRQPDEASSLLTTVRGASLGLLRSELSPARASDLATWLEISAAYIPLAAADRGAARPLLERAFERIDHGTGDPDLSVELHLANAWAAVQELDWARSFRSMFEAYLAAGRGADETSQAQIEALYTAVRGPSSGCLDLEEVLSPPPAPRGGVAGGLAEALRRASACGDGSSAFGELLALRAARPIFLAGDSDGEED